jgi:hypothetical protein
MRGLIVGTLARRTATTAEARVSAARAGGDLLRARGAVVGPARAARCAAFVVTLGGTPLRRSAAQRTLGT